MAAQEHETAVIFLHIPKTAGTTLIDILERHYPAPHRYNLGNRVQQAIVDFQQFSPAHRREIDLLYGHMAYGLHEYFPQGARYFTILRQPVERVISFYYFVRRNQEHYLYDFSQQSAPDLASFAQSSVTIMTDNFQVRLLSGVWAQVPFGGLTEAHLAMAKEHLRDNIAVVGLTERFEETLLLLQQAFNWPNVWYQPRNVTRNRPQQDELSDDTLQAIAELNRWDMALYEYAQTLFAERIAAQGPLFAWRLWWLRRSNRLMYSAWHVKRFGGRRAYTLLQQLLTKKVRA